ncbi:Uncharacterised protein [Shigella boydii]|nr:Uncharacterised protein [Shigella boydii]
MSGRPSTAPSKVTTGVPEAAARLKEHLRDFRNTHAAAQLGVSAVAALPGDRLSAALMVKSHGTVSVDGKSLMLTSLTWKRWQTARAGGGTKAA